MGISFGQQFKKEFTRKISTEAEDPSKMADNSENDNIDEQMKQMMKKFIANQPAKNSKNIRNVILPKLIWPTNQHVIEKLTLRQIIHLHKLGVAGREKITELLNRYEPRSLGPIAMSDLVYCHKFFPKIFQNPTFISFFPEGVFDNQNMVSLFNSLPDNAKNMLRFDIRDPAHYQEVSLFVNDFF